MHHSEILGIALACLAVVRAQTPGFNTFITPAADQDIRAGQNFDITWQPANAPDGATVSIKLLRGQSISTMQDGPNVASNIPSSAGRFTWAVPRSIQDNEVYSLKMTLDGKEDIFQNSAFFDIDNLDNDDDDRPPATAPAPAPNANPASPQPQPQSPAAAPATNAPPPQVQGPNPKYPGGLRPDDDDDDDDKDDDDRDDKDDRDDIDDDDDDDHRGPRLPAAVPSLPPAPPTPQAASQNSVPKAATNPKSNESDSPAIAPATPDTKTSVSLASNDISAAGSKLKNGTFVAKAETSASASAGSYPKSKSTSTGSSSSKPSSLPNPIINSGTASFAISSLSFILGGITVILAL